jgi:hypothetical protein
MVESSIEAVQLLRALALAVRSEQDFAAIPPAVAVVVGALKSTGGGAADVEEAKRRRGYEALLGLAGFQPLMLREALNKIAHADPRAADYYVGPRDNAHDLLLTGSRGGHQWFAAVSVLQLIRAIHTLPDVPMDGPP